MNMYRIQLKSGRKVLDEQTMSADTAFEAASRAEVSRPLNAGESLIVFNENGKQVFKHTCKKQSRRNGPNDINL